MSLRKGTGGEGGPINHNWRQQRTEEERKNTGQHIQHPIKYYLELFIFLCIPS